MYFKKFEKSFLFLGSYEYLERLEGKIRDGISFYDNLFKSTSVPCLLFATLLYYNPRTNLSQTIHRVLTQECQQYHPFHGDHSLPL
jgi:hypothetical protein